MKTTMHPDVNYSPRVIAGTNGDVRGLNCLRQALMRNWNNKDKDEHAIKLINRANLLADVAIDKMRDAKTFDQLVDCQLEVLRYQAMAMRIVEYRVSLLRRSK